MSSGINVNVSGGGVSIGAVNQGDAGTVSGSASLSQTEIERECRRSVEAVTQLAQAQRRSAAELEAALAAIDRLKLASQAPTREVERSKAAEVLRLTRENFSWAWPAIKDFVKVVWPSLLGLMGR